MDAQDATGFESRWFEYHRQVYHRQVRHQKVCHLQVALKTSLTREVPFQTRTEVVAWVQAIGRATNFVLVTKKSDAEGNGRRGNTWKVTHSQED
ncbi:hypothetical protein Scep_012326 [Stephania cephalantha]|uniref:Uncharacterized protein n=1 Tax=Stephania cephalantha TaxID=152367 RepID=A0AAP0JGP2_9MAGN